MVVIVAIIILVALIALYFARTHALAMSSIESLQGLVR
jgi:hypothetical protein